jgi:hypothetical protein
MVLQLVLLQDSSQGEIVRIRKRRYMFDRERERRERLDFRVQQLTAKSAEDAPKVRRGAMLRNLC